MNVLSEYVEVRTVQSRLVHTGDASHQQQREQPLGESATETDPDATSGDPPSAATNSSNVEGCDTRLPGQAPSELGLAHPATSPSRVATPPSPRPRRSPSANSQSQASVEELARSASSLAVGNMSALADLMRGVSGAGTEVGESMLSHASSEAPAWMRSMDQGSQVRKKRDAGTQLNGFACVVLGNITKINSRPEVFTSQHRLGFAFCGVRRHARSVSATVALKCRIRGHLGLVRCLACIRERLRCSFSGVLHGVFGDRAARQLQSRQPLLCSVLITSVCLVFSWAR